MPIRINRPRNGESIFMEIEHELILFLGTESTQIEPVKLCPVFQIISIFLDSPKTHCTTS